MNKRYLLFLLLFCLSIHVNAQKRVYEVGFLLDHTNPGVESLFQDLKKEIHAVVGEDAIVNFSPENVYINNYNLSIAAEQYGKLQSTADIIFTVGLYNNLLMLQQSEFPVPTIVVSSIRNEITQIDVQRETSGISNLVYLAPSGSFKEDLAQLKEFTDYKKVGIVIEKPLVKIVDFEAIFQRVCKELNTNFKLIPYENVSDIINELDDIDALYMAMSFTLNDEDTRELAKKLIEKKIPSFTAGRRQDITNGIMATNVGADSFNRFFRRTALVIESYINGTNFSELPIYIDLNNELTINYQTMQSLGIPIRFKNIGDINFVGGVIQSRLAQKTYSFKEAINTVLANNLLLKSGQKDVELSKQDVKSAKSNYLPSITSSASGAYVDPDLAEAGQGQNPEFTTSGNITLEQVVFSEGANAQISIQKSLAKAEQEKYNVEELDAIFDVSNAYLNALILKTNLGIQMRNLELTKRNLQIARDNFEGGGTAKTDLLRFRSEKAQNTQSLIEAANTLMQSFNSLNFLLNNPLDYTIDIEDVSLEEGIFKKYQYDDMIEYIENPSTHESLTQFLKQEALKNAPEIKQLDFNMEATERSIKLYKTGRYFPTIGLQGQYNQEFSRSGAGSNSIPGFPDGYYTAGVNISLPIFSRNQNNLDKQTSLIQKEQLEINKANYELLLETNIRNAISDIIVAVSNIRLSKVSESTAQEGLELTQTAYSSGAVNIAQLLDAQNNYLNARLARSNAIYSYLITMLQMERYLGSFFLLNTEAANQVFRLKFQEFLSKNSQQ